MRRLLAKGADPYTGAAGEANEDGAANPGGNATGPGST